MVLVHTLLGSHCSCDNSVQTYDSSNPNVSWAVNYAEAIHYFRAQIDGLELGGFGSPAAVYAHIICGERSLGWSRSIECVTVAATLFPGATLYRDPILGPITHLRT